MQYEDYISLYSAQKEREAQLIEKYNQKPIQATNTFIWASNSIERHTSHSINMTEVASIIGGIILVGGILGLSIWL